MDQVIQKRKNEKGIIVPWFPLNNEDLNLVGSDVVQLSKEEQRAHIQFLDTEYRNRREKINQISKMHVFGESIPRVNYTKLEEQTWVNAYQNLAKYHQKVFPEIYLLNKKDLENRLGLHQRIPQLQDLDEYLREKTNFRIKTAQGWLSQREFLNSLAHRVFTTTQYIRHHESPDYTPEPDLIHDVIGHIPFLADPVIADICQQIGLLSIGAADQELQKLGIIFLLTIEFGVCLDQGKYKAYGAGIIGSVQECQSLYIFNKNIKNFLSGNVKFENFEPSIACTQKFYQQDVQPIYYYSQSLDESLSKLLKFGESIKKPFKVNYNPITQSVISY